MSGASTFERVTAPIGRRNATVVGSKRYGPYYVVEVEDNQPVLAPGQFYMLSSSDWGSQNGRPLLPRAMSPWVTADGHLAFMLEVVGPGTEALSRLQENDVIFITGPLGKGFSDPEELDPKAERALLVAGGVGLPPIIHLHRKLADFDRSLLAGFRDSEHGAARAVLPEGASLAVDAGGVDGAHTGFVTELLVRELDEVGSSGAVMYACGPSPMLEAVRQISADRGIKTELALEAPMACGYGACFGCAVETESGYIRLCVDGPVVNADDLPSALLPEWKEEKD